MGTGKFKVVLTISGKENSYSQWLYKIYGEVDSIDFAGFMGKEKLFGYYNAADCLVFPSRIETWGLPISEFMVNGKPMLLADLPYAHETAAGGKAVAFFELSTPGILKEQMRKLLEGDFSFLNPVLDFERREPTACSWKDMFNILLKTSFIS